MYNIYIYGFTLVSGVLKNIYIPYFTPNKNPLEFHVLCAHFRMFRWVKHPPVAIPRHRHVILKLQGLRAPTHLGSLTDTLTSEATTSQGSYVTLRSWNNFICEAAKVV